MSKDHKADYSSKMPGEDNAKELDWFMFENRVRKLIAESMAPVIEHLEKNQYHGNENRLKITQVIKRFDDAEFKISSNTKKIHYLEDTIKLIKQFEGDIRLNDAKHKKEMASISNSQEGLVEQIAFAKVEIESLSTHVEALKGNIEDFNTSLYIQKSQLSDRISEVERFIRNGNNTYENKLQFLKEETMLNSSKLNQHSTKISNLDSKLRSMIAKTEFNDK